jgi:hypothetical protein
MNNELQQTSVSFQFELTRIDLSQWQWNIVALLELRNWVFTQGKASKAQRARGQRAKREAQRAKCKELSAKS